jgi:hypothetical protein
MGGGSSTGETSSSTTTSKTIPDNYKTIEEVQQA